MVKPVFPDRYYSKWWLSRITGQTGKTSIQPAQTGFCYYYFLVLRWLVPVFSLLTV